MSIILGAITGLLAVIGYTCTDNRIIPTLILLSGFINFVGALFLIKG